VTSIGGRIAFPFFGYYNATKHALEATYESLWHELGDVYPRIKIVEPGFIQTDFATRSMVSGSLYVDYSDVRMKKLAHRMETGYTGTDPYVLGKLIYTAGTDDSRQLRYIG
jgi:short-subunit dehydrogenase